MAEGGDRATQVLASFRVTSAVSASKRCNSAVKCTTFLPGSRQKVARKLLADGYSSRNLPEYRLHIFTYTQQKAEFCSRLALAKYSAPNFNVLLYASGSG